MLNVPSMGTASPGVLPQNLVQEYPALSQNIVAGAPHGPTDATDADNAAVILSHSRQSFPSISALLIP